MKTHTSRHMIIQTYIYKKMSGHTHTHTHTLTHSSIYPTINQARSNFLVIDTHSRSVPIHSDATGCSPPATILQLQLPESHCKPTSPSPPPSPSPSPSHTTLSHTTHSHTPHSHTEHSHTTHTHTQHSH